MKRLIAISLSIAFLILATHGVNYSYAAPTVTFDAATYYDDHPVTMTVTDDTLSTPPPLAVQVKITASGIECLYDLDIISEIPPTYGRLIDPYIKFTSGTTCTSNTIPLNTALPQSPGTSLSIIADYPSTGTSLASDTATVVSSNVDPFPPTPMSPAPLWGKKITSCTPYGGDQDQDGICDNWETPNGLQINYVLTPPATAQKWNLPCGTGTSDPVCPGKYKKDVYVEVDYMDGHRPDNVAIQNVKDAFLNAPTGTPPGCTSCSPGIRLHVLVDEPVPHRDNITTPIEGNAFNTDFDSIRKAYTGRQADRDITDTWTSSTGVVYDQAITSMKQAFHYALFIHQQTGDLLSSGRAELPGDDFVISLGGWTGAVGSQDQQEGTFMHELGHNLGLDHGAPIKSGGDVPLSQRSTNCKPNYLSVMSYSRQFAEVYPISRNLDYSEQAQNTINEGSLTESAGGGLATSNPANLQTVWGVLDGSNTKTALVDGSSAFDWDGNDQPTPDPTFGDINRTPPFNGIILCDGTGDTNMIGYNDWQNIMLNTRNYINWGGGLGTMKRDNIEFKYIAHVNKTTNEIFYYRGHGPNNDQKSDFVEKYLSHNWSKVKPKSIMPHEVKEEQITAVRALRVQTLNDEIQSLDDSNFNDTTLGKATLADDLKSVLNFIMQRDLYDATKKLVQTKDDVNHFITNNNVANNILAEIDNGNINLLEAASTTHPTPPLFVELEQCGDGVDNDGDEIIDDGCPMGITLTFDHPSYNLSDNAMIEVEDTSADITHNVDEVLVSVKSDSDPAGIDVTLRETGTHTGIFVEFVNLHVGSSHNGPPNAQLHVASGDNVYAYYGAINATASMN